jgi:hypothetical protein
MKLTDAIATGELFNNPYLPPRWSGNEKKMAKAIYDLKKMKISSKKKDRDPRYLDYLLYRKDWMF